MTSTHARIAYLSSCRYCTRYGSACGRLHTTATRGDWRRTWAGHPTTTTTDAADPAELCSWCDAAGPHLVGAEDLTTRDDDRACTVHLVQWFPELLTR